MNTSGGRKRRITKDRVLDVMKEADHAFLTTTEIVDRLPASRQAVNNRLDELVERGELETRLSSNIRFYWLPGRVADGPDSRVVGDELVLDLDDRLREELEDSAREEDITPERLAKDLLADGLEEPQPLWEATKNVAFAFSLIFTGAVFVQAGSFPPIVNQATLAVAVVAMGVFIVMLMGAILNPVVDPAVASAQEWWAARRD